MSPVTPARVGQLVCTDWVCARVALRCRNASRNLVSQVGRQPVLGSARVGAEGGRAPPLLSVTPSRRGRLSARLLSSSSSSLAKSRSETTPAAQTATWSPREMSLSSGTPPLNEVPKETPKERPGERPKVAQKGSQRDAHKRKKLLTRTWVRNEKAFLPHPSCPAKSSYTRALFRYW